MIRLQQVCKVYRTRMGERRVLDCVDLVIRRGERLGILGRNGAGKSTLIRLMSGAELPTSGSIERGMSISWPLAFSGGFQGSLTGMDNLRFICRVYDVPIAPAVRFVEDFAELGEYLNEPVRSYSAGMRARLAFAISMAVDFDCFLIDEIVAVGDSRFHQKCHSELFVKRADRAMVIVSHQAGYVREHCDRAAVLLDGRLHAFDAVADALAFYDHTTTLATSPEPVTP
jgi:capsular polysaccharide transport system ATP-binding protein